MPDSRRLAFADPDHPNRATIVTIEGRILDRPLLAPPGDELANLSAVPGMNALVYTAAQSDAVDQLYERLESGRLHQITRGFTAHSEPAPSPDGRLIADTEWGTPCGNCIPSDIGVLPAARPRRGRTLPNARGENRLHPSWSPNSKRLVYAVYDDDNQALIVANVDGSHRVALSQGLGRSWPAWSPDGSAIAATGTRFGALFVITRDGEHSRRLATGLEGPPSWSPDSRLIAFGRADGLYVIHRDGNGLRRILAMRGVFTVAWAPDASRIAFSAAGCQRRPQECQLRTSDIWTVRPDGRDLRRITTNLANDWWPAWLPAH